MSDKIQLDSEQWVARYGDILYRYTLLRVKNPDTAEEIVQATFLAALGSQATYQGRASEKSWLFGILKHKLMDHYREMKKEQVFDVLSEGDDRDPLERAYNEDGFWVSPPRSWDVDPEKAAENEAMKAVLLECMNKLSDKFRQVFVLREYEGMSTEEICKEFDIQPTNLWVMLHRARNQLKQCMENNWLNK